MKTTINQSLRSLIIFLISCFIMPQVWCQTATFNLSKLPERRTIRLSELGVIDIQYIPLETSAESVIQRISKIIFGKDFLVTHNFTEINVFRYNGSFVTRIGTVGRGPNEFTVAHDVDINPKTGSIYVADGWQQKFIVFSKNGKVLRTFKTPVSAALNFRFTEDGILCYNQNHMGIVETSFILIDTMGKTIRSFPNKYPWKRTVPNVAYPGENIFYRFNGSLIKKEMYTDTVYSYKNKSFEPHLIIDVGKLRLTPEIREKNSAEYLMKNYLSPVNLFEFGNFIYYEFIIPWEGKTEGLSYIGSKNGKINVLFDPEIEVFNDFDAGPNIWPKTAKDNSTLVAWIDAIKFKQYVISTEFKTTKPVNSEKKKGLEKLALSINETDNPVIVLIKVK